MELYINSSQTNNTHLSYYTYQLDTLFLVFIVISSLIGLIFNILCIIRYYRRPLLRTYFTYIFHFILIYCLLASLFINPSLLIGYYGYEFTNYHIYCKCYGVIGSAMYVGIAYSLLYTSIERHYLTFHQNGQLTIIRQILPMSSILIISFITSTAFYLIPKCVYIPCISCATYNLKLLIFWQAYSFFFPLICLVFVTIILIIRVKISRKQFRHQRQINQFHPSKKIVIQLCIYVLWGIIYYCPPALYNLFTVINPEKYSSPIMKSISTIIGVLGIQLYPVLTYVMFWKTKQNRNNRSRIHPEINMRQFNANLRKEN